MPIYEYECTKCHHRFERIQKFSDPHVKKCPECGGAVELVLSAPAVQFKGSGWYVTDYGKGGSSSHSRDGGSKKEGKPAEKKTDSTAKAESPTKSDKK